MSDASAASDADTSDAGDPGESDGSDSLRFDSADPAALDTGDAEGEPPDEGEGIFGEAAPATPIEPETPSIENAAFVLLGVASTVALILHLVSLLG